MPINWSGFKWITIKELSAVSYAERNFGRVTAHTDYFSPGHLEKCTEVFGILFRIGVYFE